MKLSVVTITYNNIQGLQRTIQSFTSQTILSCQEADMQVEHIIVDGGSTDGSVDVIREYASLHHTPYTVHWISEKDNGVYDAQNKGIGMATGDYCYFLNAGDVLISNDVLERMMTGASAGIVYGNELVVDKFGKVVGRCNGVDNPSFLQLYQSCMKHQASFIQRDLFHTYGVYDAEMRICSDWEWFWRVIGFHKDVTLEYRDVDVAYFGNDGISYSHPDICAKERQMVLDRYLSRWQQRGMKLWAFMNRVVRYIKKKWK